MYITILVKQVYWYISQVSGERLQDHWSSGVYSILQGLCDKPPSSVKPIHTSYRFPTHQYTTETAISLVRLSRFALRASPITCMRLVDPDQRVITGLKCTLKIYSVLGTRPDTCTHLRCPLSQATRPSYTDWRHTCYDMILCRYTLS